MRDFYTAEMAMYSRQAEIAAQLEHEISVNLAKEDGAIAARSTMGRRGVSQFFAAMRSKVSRKPATAGL